MFGLGKNKRRRTRGFFGNSSLRNTALAGVGMLALRWWHNRRPAGRSPTAGTRHPADHAAQNWTE